MQFLYLSLVLSCIDINFYIILIANLYRLTKVNHTIFLMIFLFSDNIKNMVGNSFVFILQSQHIVIRYIEYILLKRDLFSLL